MNTDIELLKEAYTTVTEAGKDPIHDMLDDIEGYAGVIHVFSHPENEDAVGVNTHYATYHIVRNKFIQIAIPYFPALQSYYTACEQELNKALAMHIKFEYADRLAIFKIPFSRQALNAVQAPLHQLYVKAMNPQD